MDIVITVFLFLGTAIYIVYKLCKEQSDRERAEANYNEMVDYLAKKGLKLDWDMEVERKARFALYSDRSVCPGTKEYREKFADLCHEQGYLTSSEYISIMTSLGRSPRK